MAGFRCEYFEFDSVAERHSEVGCGFAPPCETVTKEGRPDP